MANSREVTGNVQTNPIIIDGNRWAILQIGTNLNEVTAKTEAASRLGCALGEQACALTLSFEPGEVASIYGSCTECPNPERVLNAVFSIIDLADQRIAAAQAIALPEAAINESSPEPIEAGPGLKLTQVELWGGKQVQVLTASHLKELSAASPNYKLTDPEALIEALAGVSWIHREGFHELIIDAGDIATTSTVSGEHYIVAEGIDAIVNILWSIQRSYWSQSSINGSPFMPTEIGTEEVHFLDYVRSKIADMGIEQIVVKPSELDEILIDKAELDIEVRAINCLRRSGIKTLKDLVTLTVEDIINIPGIGTMTTDKIVVELSKQGLHLPLKD